MELEQVRELNVGGRSVRVYWWMEVVNDNLRRFVLVELDEEFVW